MCRIVVQIQRSTKIRSTKTKAVKKGHFSFSSSCCDMLEMPTVSRNDLKDMHDNKPLRNRNFQL